MRFFFFSLLLLLASHQQLFAQKKLAEKSKSTFDEGITPVTFTVYQIDVMGNLLKPSDIEGYFKWVSVDGISKLQVPVLIGKYKLNYDSNWKVIKVEGERVRVIDAPKYGNDEIVIEMKHTTGLLHFTFEDTDQSQREFSLFFDSNHPVRSFVHSHCVNLGLKLSAVKEDSKNLFIGMDCYQTETEYVLYFFRSEEGKWNFKTGISKIEIDPNKLIVKKSVPRPQDNQIYESDLMTIGTIDAAGVTNEFKVTYIPNHNPVRQTFQVGLGYTYYDYFEKAPNLKFTEHSLTGKVTYTYRLIPKILDTAFNIFGTLQPLAWSVSTIKSTMSFTPARFLGVNGRIGYRLPFEMGAKELNLLTGWYYWKMFVNVSRAQDSYGVASLNGPQIFLMYKNFKRGSAGWWAYIKYARISDGANFGSNSNRELAIGGGRQFKTSSKYSVTLDLAQTQFSKGKNSMKLKSYSLGVGYNF